MAALAEAFIRVRPNTTGFSAEAKRRIEQDPPTGKAKLQLDAADLNARLAQIRAQIRDLSRQRITVGADVSTAESALRKLRAELKSGTGRDKVQVEADVTRATAQLDQLRAQAQGLGRQRASLSIDVGEAVAKLRLVNDELRNVDGKRVRAKVDVDVQSGLRSLGLLTAGIGAAAGIGVGIGASIGVGAVVAGGIGASIAGLAGIGAAVSALGDQTKTAGAAAATAASNELTMASAIDRVRSAQAALANTRASAADSARRASDQEAAAARALTAAQDDLNRARVDALQRIRDLAREQEALARQQGDLALAQRGAAIGVREAYAELTKVLTDPHATQIQRDRAQQSYDEAVRQNANLKAQAQDLARQAISLAAQKADADRKGIAGSGLVRAAERKVAEARRQAHAVALDAASAQRQAAFQVVQAQQAVIDAQRGVQQASVAAGAGGAASMDKLHAAMANLSPAGQEFAVFLRGFIDGPLRDLRFSAQAGLLPGLQAGLASLGPVIRQNLPAIREFAAVFGQALGGLIRIAGRFATPFLKIATVALEALAPLEGVFQRFADAFGHMIDQMVADGTIDSIMSSLVKLIDQMLQSLPQLLPLFAQMAQQLLPELVKLFPNLVGLLEVLLPIILALAKAFLPVLSAALMAVTPLLQVLGDVMAAHPAVVQALAVALGVLGVAVFALSSPVALVIAVVLGLAAGLAYAWKHSETFRSIVTRSVGAAVQVFATIGGAVQAAYADVRRWFGDVVSFVAGLPQRIGHAARGMWDGLKDAFKAAINWIISKWNEMDFTISVPQVHIPGTDFDIGGGSFTLGLPDIPPLATGGIVKARQGGTLVLAGEAGRDEAVIPLDANGGFGMPLRIEIPVYLNGREIARAVDEYKSDQSRRGPRA